MTIKKLFILSIILSNMVFFSCSKEEAITPTEQPEGETATALDRGWFTGTLPEVVAKGNLSWPILSLTGPKIYVSNNPEIFTGEGWLMNNAGKTHCNPERSSTASPLAGEFMLYLYHINGSNAQRYMHIVVSNPGTSNISVTYKGSIYNQSDYSFGNSNGPSYYVSEDWLDGSGFVYNQTASVTIAPGTGKSIMVKAVPGKSGVDGIFEMITSGNAYVYTVVTNNGNANRAVDLTQTTCAPYRYLAPGDRTDGTYKVETAGTSGSFGREAGIYQTSEVAGQININLPSYNAYKAYCVNTTNKKGTGQQEQCTPAIMRLNGSSSLSYGNYGHNLIFDVKLTNPNSFSRTVDVYLGESDDAPFRNAVKWNGVKKEMLLGNASGQTWPAKRLLGTYTIGAGQTQYHTLTFYQAGLNSTDQQLIFNVR